MTQKNIVIALAAVLIIFTVVLFVHFVIGGPEDTWICEDDQWIKHGQPQAPKPASGCGETSWDDALKSIRDCQVSKLFQTSDHKVTLILKSGKYAYSIEPLLDAVLQEAASARGKCGDVPVVSD